MHVSSGQRFTSRARSPSQRQEGVRLDRCGARVTPPQPWRRQFDSHLPLTPRRQGRLLDGAPPVGTGWPNPWRRELSLSPSPLRFTKRCRRCLKVEITRYVSPSKSMSLLDELVENERAASDPLWGSVIFSHFRPRIQESPSPCAYTRYRAHDRAQTCWSTSSKPGELPLGEPRTAPQLRPQVAYLLDAPFLFALEAVSVVLGGGQVLRGHRHSLCVRANL